MKAFTKNIISKKFISFAVALLLVFSVFAGGKKDKSTKSEPEQKITESEAEIGIDISTEEENSAFDSESEMSENEKSVKNSDKQSSARDKNSIHVATLNSVMTIPCAYLMDNKNALENGQTN